MKSFGYILLLLLIFLFADGNQLQAQDLQKENSLTVTQTFYEGDSIPNVNFYTLYVYPPLNFKSKKQQQNYYKLIRDVKKTLPIARMIRQIIIESYEYMMTLPTEKDREKHVKRLEKGLKEQYTAQLKKLSFSQGKLLIKLVDRECNQTTYDLIKAFAGSFKAGFYQTFASMFGANLKKTYDPDGEDAMTESIIKMIENGQL